MTSEPCYKCDLHFPEPAKQTFLEARSWHAVVEAGNYFRWALQLTVEKKNIVRGWSSQQNQVRGPEEGQNSKLWKPPFDEISRAPLRCMDHTAFEGSLWKNQNTLCFFLFAYLFISCCSLLPLCWNMTFLPPSYFHKSICEINYFESKPTHGIVRFTLGKGFGVNFFILASS